ncbi:MAG: hypothetical protein QOJ37_3955, partial [Pseudonocardiales bacterium]|nr:hypothetical protein [Pseudonocardiales bacterium]
SQSEAIGQQAASATVDLAKLQNAFTNIYATIDEIDTFKVAALDSMTATDTALEGQIQRAQPYLERTRRGAGATAELGGQGGPSQIGS